MTHLVDLVDCFSNDPLYLIEDRICTACLKIKLHRSSVKLLLISQKHFLPFVFLDAHSTLTALVAVGMWVKVLALSLECILVGSNSTSLNFAMAEACEHVS
jgi:hypothetical protein